MAKGRTKFKIKNKDLDALVQTIAAEAGNRVKNNFGDLRPLVVKIIDDEIKNKQGNFIPTLSEAAELGIGKGGKFDFNKINTAWQAMQIKFNEGVTTFTVQKEAGGAAKKNRGKPFKIGIIKFDINEQSFYDSNRSNIDTPDTVHLDEIPWMKWFVEGKAISNARFSDKEPVSSTSRTGAGIMIKGGLWDFQPRTVKAIHQLVDDIEDRLNIRLIIEGASILGR